MRPLSLSFLSVLLVWCVCSIAFAMVCVRMLAGAVCCPLVPVCVCTNCALQAIGLFVVPLLVCGLEWV